MLLVGVVLCHLVWRVWILLSHVLNGAAIYSLAKHAPHGQKFPIYQAMIPWSFDSICICFLEATAVNYSVSVCIGSWERYYVDENLHYFYYFTKITILRILKIIFTKYYLHVLHEMVSLRTYTHISFAFTINVKAKMGIRKCMAYGIPICFTRLIQAIINHNMNCDTNEWRRLLEVSTTGRSSTLATVSSIS